MGLPIAIALSGGEVSDFKGYLPVMEAEGPAPKVLLADKGYDADFIRKDMERRGGFAMIPTKRNRLVQIPVDGAIYALRNMIERCFNKLKNARRLATRYDKTAASYRGFINLVSMRLWLKEFVNTPYAATDKLADNGIRFMPGPPDTYYDQSHARVIGHAEPIEAMKKYGILIDGEGVVDGAETKILLQIFSKTVIGPIFFEFIQRKGDDGFGEGNFRALFESIEEDQIRRGVLKVEAAE